MRVGVEIAGYVLSGLSVLSVGGAVHQGLEARGAGQEVAALEATKTKSELVEAAGSVAVVGIAELNEDIDEAKADRSRHAGIAAVLAAAAIATAGTGVPLAIFGREERQYRREEA